MQLCNGFRRKIRQRGRQKILFKLLANEVELIYSIPIEKQAVGKTRQEIIKDYLSNETSRPRADF